MGINIQTNINLLRFMGNAYNTNLVMQNAMKRLSSGIKINSASDDAAGLALSQQLTMRINSNNIAKNNTQTGIAMLNTADGALGNMVNSLQRMRDLAVQAANGVYTDEERAMLQAEVTQLAEDVNQSYNATSFGSKKLFAGASDMIKPVTVVKKSEMAASGYDAAHIINNATELVSKVQMDMGGKFILAGDIDMSSLPTASDSIIAGTFAGIFDGNGYKIKNFNIDTLGAAIDNIGLFSQVSGTIKNLGTEGFSVSATNSTYIGGLVGTINGGTIDNCYANGSVTGYMRTGVLAGLNNNGGTIKYSYSGGSCSSNGWSAGGLLGMSDNGSTVTKSYSSASITATDLSSGGLVASQYNGSTVSDSYATGNVNGYANIGGVVGRNSNSLVTNSYATGDVFGSAGSVGSIVGWNDGGTVTNSYGTGDVSGGAFLGGAVGEMAGGSVDGTNFYKNNMSADADGAVDANTLPPPTSGWDTNIWDLSSGLPKLKVFDSASSSAEVTNLQVGTENSDDSQISLSLAFALGEVNFDIGTGASASSSIAQIDAKIEKFNTLRSNIGASTNRLQGALQTQDSRLISYADANSTIKDSDMASESAKFAKQQILQNAASTLFSKVKNLDKDLALQLLNF